MSKAVGSRRVPKLFEALEDRRHLSLTVKLDYTYDTSGFFASQQRRDVLQAAVNSVASRINDTFTAITPAGGNAWTASFTGPSSTAAVTIANPNLAADTMVLYVGARAQLSAAFAGPAGLSVMGSATWQETVAKRGRPVTANGTLATPSIGVMSFNPTVSWYSGLSAPGPTDPYTDLFSVAVHEFGHVLGMGTTSAWFSRVSQNAFTGTASQAVHGGPVPVNAREEHWDFPVRVEGQLAAMTPNPEAGTRHQFTRVDFAALKDLGYDVNLPAAVLGQYGTVTGYSYVDANKNGRRDAGEGAVNATMLLDRNGNGEQDPHEPFAFVDADGKYTFTGVPIGAYTLAQVDLSGQYVRVSPTADASVTVVADSTVRPPEYVSRSYGTISGRVFFDDNKNGLLDPNESPAAFTGVYLDTDDDGKLSSNEPRVAVNPDGTFRLTGLEAGTFAVRVSSYVSTTDALVTLAEGQTVGNVLIGITVFTPPPPKTTTVSGIVFSDLNKNGVQSDIEPMLAGVTVYVDVDNDKVMDANERRVVTDDSGWFVISGLTDTGAATRVRAILPTGATQILPTNGTGYPIDFKSIYPVDVGYFAIYLPPVTPPATGTLSGFAFDDKNKNGLFDTGETKTSGKTVFLDADSNGKLDAGEKKTTTGTNGVWSFAGLAAGNYHVRRVFPAGYAPSTTPIDLTLAAGQTVADLLIGSAAGTVTPTPVNTASIAGVAFNDVNKNGRYDTGDTLASGKTIWLDLDDDGVRDSTEPSIVTASDGSFTFKSLAAGKYHVRRVFSNGYAESTPARYVTLTSGQASTGVLIGSKLK